MKRVLITLLLGLVALMPQMILAGEKAGVFVQLGNMGQLQAGSISPDGSFILSAPFDSLVLWSADSGREIRRFEKQDDYFTSVAFSPDGLRAVSGGGDKDVKLWDVSTGRLTHRFHGHLGAINSVIFSPNGDFILSGSDDKTAKLWDIASGKLLRSYDTQTMGPIALSPDGKFFLSEGNVPYTYGNILKLWDIETGEEVKSLIGKQLNGANELINYGTITAMAFSPDGHLAASGGVNIINLWDVPSGKLLRAIHPPENEAFRVSIEFSPDGQLLLYSASTKSKKTIQVWEVLTGNLRHSFKTDFEFINFATFSADGKYILSGGGAPANKHSEMKYWDVYAGKILHEFPGAGSGIQAVAVNQSSNHLLTANNDGAIVLWNTDSGALVRGFTGHVDAVSSLEFTNSGAEFVSGSLDGTTKIWRLDDGKVVRNFASHEGAVNSISLSSDHKRILSAENDKSIRLWNIKFGGNSILFIPNAIEDRLNSIDFSPDGKSFISGGLSSQPLTEKQKKQLEDPYGFPVVLTPVGEIAFWDVKSGKKVFTSNAHDAEVNTVRFSPDGKYAATAGDDNIIILWDAKIHTIIKQFIGHTAWIMSLAFTPDGRSILSASQDGTIRQWDIKSAQEIRKFTGHASSVNTIAVSADGLHLFSGSADSTTRIWDIKTGKELLQMASFDDGEWIAITPEGYYNSSPNGHEYLNVRLGNKVYGIDQFYDVFYRPDIVRAKLAGLDISDMITLTIDEAIQNPPPEVKVGNAPESTSKENIQLAYNIESTGGGIGEVRVFHNGKLVKSDGTIRRTPVAMMGTSVTDINSDFINRSLRGFVASVDSNQEKAGKSLLVAKAKSSPFKSKVELEPVPGENEVSIIAFNAQNSVQSLMKTIRFESTRKEVPPRLYILAVGIDKYVDEDAKLSYAAKDAHDMASRLKQKAEKMYGMDNVFIQTLYDAEATRDGILTKLKEMEPSIKGTDHFILFVASHGVLLGDQYYMVTHDYDGTLQRDKLISSNEIVDFSKSIRALSQLYILDTCHAGGMDGIIAGLYDARMSILAKKMGLYIYASADSLEEALDGYKGNGLFTHNLLDGLNDNTEADSNKDKSISLAELGNFARDKTKEIAKQLGYQQEPLIINFGQDRTVYQLQ